MKHSILVVLAVVMTSVFMVGCGSPKSKGKDFKKRIEAAIKEKDEAAYKKVMNEMGEYLDKLSDKDKIKFTEAWGGDKEYATWNYKMMGELFGNKLGEGMKLPTMPASPSSK